MMGGNVVCLFKVLTPRLLEVGYVLLSAEWIPSTDWHTVLRLGIEAERPGRDRGGMVARLEQSKVVVCSVGSDGN